MKLNNLFIDGYQLPKPLETEETRELFSKLKEGNGLARQRLIEHNMRLVLSISRKYDIGIKYEREDLISVGTFGLIKAIDTFDLSRNIKFSTYASRCIENEILMFLRKVVKEQNVDSLDMIINYNEDGNKLRLEDLLSDNIDIEDEYIDNETYAILQRLIDDLSNEEKEIVMMIFGYYDRPYSVEEIARKFNVAHSTISRWVSKIIEKLKFEFEKEYDISLQNNKRKKKVKIKNFYELLSQYSKEEIQIVLANLSNEEQELIKSRYKGDLNNCEKNNDWNKELNLQWINLIRRIKTKLRNAYEQKNVNVKNK